MSDRETGLSFRAPPHSNEAEQSLIGALILDNQAFDRVADLVTAEDFYRDDHRRIFRHLSRLIEQNRPADVVTLTESIQRSEDKDKIPGGPAYLAGLSQMTPTALNVRRYAEIVHERSVQRRLAQVATEIAEEALSSGGGDIGQLLDEAESKILQIGEASARRTEGPVDLKPLLSRVFERLDHLHCRDNKSDVTGVPTGFVDLDSKTSGMQPGDLVLIAGRPSMGKTALALNMAEHVGIEKGLPVVIFSMEMSSEQLTQRLISSMSLVNSHAIRTGRLDDSDWSKVTEAIGRMHEAPIHIDDGGALTALQVRTRARRIKRRYSKLGLIVIDYIQLMASKSQGENRATEVSEISRSLKAMAKELECPVIALSQLNRAVDQRPDRRPVMSDLRESGALEQDADVIMFVYREAVYTHDLPEEQRGCAELIIGKQRNGPIGTVKLIFRGQYTRFENFQDPTFDGSFSWPTRGAVRKAAKVRSFSDYKQSAGGPDAA